MHQRLQPGELGKCHRPAVGGQFVVAASLAVGVGGAVGCLDDEAVVDQPVQRPVQRARAHLHCAVTELAHPSHQRIAVQLTAEQGEHDVERGGRERLRRCDHTRSMIYRISIVKGDLGHGRERVRDAH